MITIEVKADQISDYFKGLTMRTDSLRLFLERNVYKAYQNIQRKRWMTQNTSEGEQWETLKSKSYINWKKLHYRADEAGRPILIASGKLFRSVVGPAGKDGHKMVATNTSLIVGTSVEYAPMVNQTQRKFTGYSQTTINELETMISDFVFKNIVRPQKNA